jgi:hypothetical protein
MTPTKISRNSYKKIKKMKHVKLFEQFINESFESKVKSLLPGAKLTRTDDPEDVEEYEKAETYYISHKDIKPDMADYGFSINIYDGKDFAFFFDGAPISTSLHSSSERDKMARTQIEVPKPLSKLTPNIFKEAIEAANDNSESVSEAKEGPNAIKFDKMVDDTTMSFIDAVGAEKEEGGDLPKEYYDALKKLGIKKENAGISFSGSVGSSKAVLDAAKKAGLKYVEVEDPETGNLAIVFDLTK